METKDGSYGFDFEAVYTDINKRENFTYVGDGRYIPVEFKETNRQTEIIIALEPGEENSILHLEPNSFKHKVPTATLNNWRATYKSYIPCARILC